MAKKPQGLRAQLKAIAPRMEVVTVDGCPEPITIKAPSLSDRILVGAAYRDLQDNPAAAAQRGNAVGVCASAHDKAGERIWDPENEDDINEVMHLAPHVLEALVFALGRVNGTIKTVEQAEKN